MQVSVETLKGLERKITISVPAVKIEEEVSLRLRNLTHKVKIDGFRPGKAPLSVIKSRYSAQILEEVANEMIQSTLFEALKQENLTPAGTPKIDLEQLELGKDFKYCATIEIFPEISINELGTDTIELISSTVKDKDVDDMINKLRAQHKNWIEVTRPVAAEDKINIDFQGFIDGNPFEGGQADNYELTLGAGTMIPGFEEGLIGVEKDKVTDINVTFPEQYGHQPLAGKSAVFKVTVKNIQEGILPELDDTFAEKFNIKEGGIVALREDIKKNMVRELDRRVRSRNREIIFDKLLEKNSFDIPETLVEQEIGHLQHEMYHRVFGHEHSDNEKIPDFPRELFEDKARHSVQLGLLFSEYVKLHQIVVDKVRVDAMIDRLAEAYEDPQELRSWYEQDKERMAEIEALAMEDMVADIVIKDATVLEKSVNYDAVMNAKKDQAEIGA